MYDTFKFINIFFVAGGVRVPKKSVHIYCKLAQQEMRHYAFSSSVLAS